MDGMFAKCEKLKKPDISHFNLKNAGNVEGMFDGCWTTSSEMNAAQKRIASEKNAGKAKASSGAKGSKKGLLGALKGFFNS